MDGVENIFTFIGSFIYKNNILEQISTETGQVLKTEDTYKYQYFLKNHLGSIRVMFEDSASTANIIQETHYYPYGMKIAGLSYTSISSNNKLFSSKELQSEMNLNWYDFHARQYMPDLGVFGSFDPLAEAEITNTPYNYCANNPVNFVDPTGMAKSPISGWLNDDMNSNPFGYSTSGNGTGSGGGRKGSPYNTQNYANFLKYQKLDSDNHNVSFEEFIIELQNEGEIIIDIYDVCKNGALEYKSTRTFTLAQSSGNNTPLFDIEASAEVGLVVGAKVKIFGIGGESKLGVSKQLMKGSLSEGTTYGGDWSLSAAFGAGPLGVNASKSLTSGDASIGGNLFIYNANMDLVNYNQNITILDLNTYFGIGGSLKVMMNIDRVIMPMRPDDYRVKIDNTRVTPRILHP